MSNERLNFYYDPVRDGYNTDLWKTLGGAPASTGTALRLNAASTIGYADIFKGEQTMAVKVPSNPNAFLTGGAGATAVIATWNAVSDGEFSITIDGVARDIIGLDFSLAGDMDAVAAIIQAGIRAVTLASEICVWDTDHFVIIAVSAITVTSAVAGGTGTDISGAGATAFMDSDVGNGVVTDAADREFGLEQISAGAKLSFKISDGVLTCESAYQGNTSSVSISWNSPWVGVNTLFQIKWTGFSAEFLINGVQVAFISDSSVPKIPLSSFIRNTSADNMDVSYIETMSVQGYI